MSVIHILDSETIDKIAAGEVVERPSSVVKELVENAIDAGATAVTVEAKDGGISMVRVTDNGYGIERSQLRSAFLRHATSKIETAEDLSKIVSLGFRGEALSSIAAVSQVEIITKTADSLTGTRLQIDGGEEKSFDEVGAPDGTTFIMRNIFFNTPVRRKFLKQAATEGSYITDLMEHLALSRPDISFKLVIGSQTRFHTSGNGDLKEVIYRIYGREIAASVIPIQAEKRGMKVEGYLGKPVLVRSNRNYEIYYMNGRFIRSTIVAKALEEGYKEYLMQHKFPFCVLHLTMDPEQVDVNVHPTKMDVRFSDGYVVSEFLADAVREALKNREMIPQDRLKDEKEIRREEKQQREAAYKIRTPEPFEQQRRMNGMVREESGFRKDGQMPAESAAPGDKFAASPVWERVREISKASLSADKLSEEQCRNLAARGTKDFHISETTVTTGNLPKISEETGEILTEQETEEFFTETFEAGAETAATQPMISEITEKPAEDGKNVQNQKPEEQKPEEQKLYGQLTEKSDANQQNAAGGEETKQLNLFEERILTRKNKDRYKIIGQVFDTYWMFQFEDKLCILDQHAAHEKVKYERFMKRYREKEILSQNLFPPVIISLSGQEELVLKEYWDIFKGMGFEVEDFGGNEYALRGVPVDLYGCSEREMFLEVLDELSGGIARQNPGIIEEKIATMSCKAAVKGNNHLSYEEADRLIDELLTLDNPYNCPHGRPTIITISKYEMEKKFKRIV